MKKLHWDFLRRDRNAPNNKDDVKPLSNKARLSFSDLLGRNQADGRQASKSGILDTLKRRFKRSERVSKRLSLSMQSVTEETSEVVSRSRTLPSVQQACRSCSLPLRRGLSGNCCGQAYGIGEMDILPEQKDDHNENVLSTEEQDAKVGSRGSKEAKHHDEDLVVPSPNIVAPSTSTSGNSNLAWELFKLVKYGWYWGRMTRGEAERKLADQPDGAFLVRDSSDDCHLLSLSFRSYRRTLHTRIEHTNGYFSFYAYPEAEQHSSVSQLIEHLMDTSRSGIFCYSRSRSPESPSYPVRLTKPVSRFSEVLPLQYMCRFVIRQYVRMDHIEALPLPESLKSFIVRGNS